MIDATHKYVCFVNKSNGNTRMSGVIDQQTINPHDLCYKCSKDTPESLFVKFRKRDFRDESYFPAKENHFHVKSK